jgi:hypothetical protein
MEEVQRQLDQESGARFLQDEFGRMLQQQPRESKKEPPVLAQMMDHRSHLQGFQEMGYQMSSE